MASSGISYFIGRESNDKYGESLSGFKQRTLSIINLRSYRSFCNRRDPSSGLLARISDKTPGPEGFGDSKMQAYNFRLCLTQGCQ